MFTVILGYVFVVNYFWSVWDISINVAAGYHNDIPTCTYEQIYTMKATQIIGKYTYHLEIKLLKMNCVAVISMLIICVVNVVVVIILTINFKGKPMP
jgi:hypothetical protein